MQVDDTLCLQTLHCQPDVRTNPISDVWAGNKIFEIPFSDRTDQLKHAERFVYARIWWFFFRLTILDMSEWEIPHNVKYVESSNNDLVPITEN